MTARTVVIAVAGLRLGFAVCDARMAGRIGRRYAGWTADKGRPHILFDCVFGNRRLCAKNTEPGVTATVRGGRLIVRSDFECSWTNRTGVARLRRSIYSFDAMLRVLIGTLLPLRGGLIMHASAVAAGGRGYVFAGRSGSGKTTVARLLDKRTVLNDEICAVTPGRHAAVSGTPFWGEMGTGPAHARRYPLAALCFLVKAPVTERVRIPAGEAIKRVLACVCFFSRTAPDSGLALKAASALAARVPCYELRFRRDRAEIERAVIAAKGG